MMRMFRLIFQWLMRIEITSTDRVSIDFNLSIENGKKKNYEFSIVQDWVKYPIKDPTKFFRFYWEDDNKDTLVEDINSIDLSVFGNKNKQ